MFKFSAYQQQKPKNDTQMGQTKGNKQKATKPFVMNPFSFFFNCCCWFSVGFMLIMCSHFTHFGNRKQFWPFIITHSYTQCIGINGCCWFSLSLSPVFKVACKWVNEERTFIVTMRIFTNWWNMHAEKKGIMVHSMVFA